MMQTIKQIELILPDSSQPILAPPSLVSGTAVDLVVPNTNPTCEPDVCIGISAAMSDDSSGTDDREGTPDIVSSDRFSTSHKSFLAAITVAHIPNTFEGSDVRSTLARSHATRNWGSRTE